MVAFFVHRTESYLLIEDGSNDFKPYQIEIQLCLNRNLFSIELYTFHFNWSSYNCKYILF